MRILLVNDYATPTGGAELMVIALRRALRERGHDARILASSARPLGLASHADYECFGVSSILRGVSQVANPSAYQKLRRVLREFNPDVVHVRLFLSQLSPLILPLLRDVPSVFHVAWYRSICSTGTKMLPNGARCTETAGTPCLRNGCVPLFAWPSAMLQQSLWRYWRHSFNHIVANSDATRNRLEAEGLGPIEVVWNGVPRREARQSLSPRPTIVFAGRLVWEKGCDVLIRAFARIREQVPDAQLLIAGDGSERAPLQKEANQLRLGSSIFFLGHISREEMEAKFRNAWVQVAPSRWEEPFGISAAEALMRGTPVIASNTGGLAEFITPGETGLLVPPQNERELANTLLLLTLDPQRNQRMGLCARAFATRRLTEEVFVDRFLEIYAKLCRQVSLSATV